jgi:hypothetical protein
MRMEFFGIHIANNNLQPRLLDIAARRDHCARINGRRSDESKDSLRADSLADMPAEGTLEVLSVSPTVLRT